MTARVMCFGDSLTWGFDPASGGRFPIDRVWPAVMAEAIGVTAVVEALPGRTTVIDSPYAPGRSGEALLGPLLESHAPLDAVVVMLGTNDLQRTLGASARHAASGLWTLIDIVRRSACGPEGGAPAVLAVAPPHIVAPSGFMGVFYEGQEEESRHLAEHYAVVARQAGVAFFDAAEAVAPSPVDGIHLDLAGQLALGEALAEQVQLLLADVD